MKTPVLKNDTKNSAVFTVPIASFGALPLLMRFDVTKGPHPPPPTESRKPPKRPSKPKFLFCG